MNKRIRKDRFMSFNTNEKISIIIAAYNEEDNIGRAIESVRNVLPGAEIIVVDDGSTDHTFERAKQYEQELMKIIYYPQNKGKGHAIRAGINAATGTIMTQIDADLQFPAEGLCGLIQPIIDRKADIVFGTRYLDSSNIDNGSVTFLKRAASFVMGWLITFITHQRHTDVFAGFKAWRSSVIRDINFQENDFTYEAEIAIKAKQMGYKVVEVQTSYQKRTSGCSKIRILYHAVVITRKILKLAYFNR